MRRVIAAFAALALIELAACNDSGTEPDEAIYTVAVEGEQFRIRVRSAQAIARLEERLATNTSGVILGRVAIGDGGINAPWSWHLAPSSIEVPDVAIELCDGLPSHVEQQRDEWIAQVRNYCPWGARVVARVSP
jgi:hypothetical protein